MIQRKQTVFLLIAVILGMVHFQAWSLFAVQILASAISLIAIFLYKRRPLQANLCMALMGLGVVYYIAIGFYQHKLQGQLQFTWPMVLTAVAIIFWFLARKRIIKDEKLVRSLDRIR